MKLPSRVYASVPSGCRIWKKPSPLTATRYHSLVVRRDSVPDCLEITAEVSDGTVMGLRHR